MNNDLKKDLSSYPPKVSVIIPVFNIAAHVERCVRSVMKQTLEDIEIVCVDDASTDSSLQILKALEAEDGRVKVLSLPENLTANQARKNGVLASRGSTIMFVDGDDEILPHACETVWRAITKYDVDVLHFGARVINKSGVNEGRIQWNQNKIAPCLDRIEGDLIAACFEQERFFFTLWNKAFRGDLARKAFTQIKDGRFPRAQDLYAVFCLLYFSRTYRGVNDVLLHYHFGHGITGQHLYELPSFERFCQASRVANALRDFVKHHDKWDRYGITVMAMRKKLLQDALGQWINHLQPEDRKAGYDLLAQNWEAEELVSALSERYAAERERFDIRKIARYVKGAATLLPKNNLLPDIKSNKTIGIFYHRFHSGGVQRVISLLMPRFLKFGWKVVLITDEHEPGKEYPIPKGVPRVLIPAYQNGKNYHARAEALSVALRKYAVDVLNYHATSSEGCIFDLMLAKHMGCRVVLSRHELAFASFLTNTAAPLWHSAVYSLADKITVLTRMDEQYYRLMGVPAVFVPNPKPNLELQPLRALQASPVVLWVGRMDFVQKQCQEPIEIMHEVVRAVPGAKLLMLGGGWTQNAEDSMRKRINSLGLQQNVELLGYTPQPEKYYRDAACQLVTSSWESYLMVIEESRTFGLPLVMYELPYLELLQNGKGYIAVEQLDRQAAANALIRLLKDPELREQIGREAQEELAIDTNGLLEQRWQEILEFPVPVNITSLEMDPRQLRLFMENALHLYTRGLTRRRQEMAELQKKLKGPENAKDSVPTAISSKPTIRTSELASNTAAESPTLKILNERKSKVGSVGAIDFLIDMQRRKDQLANVGHLSSLNN